MKVFCVQPTTLFSPTLIPNVLAPICRQSADTPITSPCWVQTAWQSRSIVAMIGKARSTRFLCVGQFAPSWPEFDGSLCPGWVELVFFICRCGKRTGCAQKGWNYSIDVFVHCLFVQTTKIENSARTLEERDEEGAQKINQSAN